MKHTYKTAFFLLLSFLIPLYLSAQAPPLEPEDPEMIVPEVILQIEDLTAEQVIAPLPVAGDLPLPEITLPSPEPGEGVFPLLPPVPHLPDIEGALPEGPATFFSEALVGGGLNNRLIGDIALYKLGEGPRFSIRFAHDGTDGYSGRESGTGFFDRSDLLEGNLQGSVKGDGNGWRYGFDAAWLEEEHGLQGEFSDARSVVLRSSSVHAEFRFPEEARFDLSFSGDYRSSSRLFAGGAVPLQELDETFLHPVLAGSFRGKNLLAQLRFAYRGVSTGEEESRNEAYTALLLEGKLPFMEISAEGMVHWDFSGSMRYPFFLKAEGGWRDSLLYSSSGGFRIEEEQWFDYWTLFPYWSNGSILPLRELWYWEGSVEISTASRFGIRGAWDFQYGDLSPLLSPSGSTVAGGGPFSPLFRTGYSLMTTGEMFWNFSPGISAGVGYTGWFFEEFAPLMPERQILSWLEYSYREGVLFGRAQAAFSLWEDQTVPVVDLSLAWQAAEGVVMNLSGEDLLEPFLEDGRTWIDPFIRKGAQLTLELKISL
jgi:hypothetical protein